MFANSHNCFKIILTAIFLLAFLHAVEKYDGKKVEIGPENASVANSGRSYVWKSHPKIISDLVCVYFKQQENVHSKTYTPSKRNLCAVCHFPSDFQGQLTAPFRYRFAASNNVPLPAVFQCDTILKVTFDHKQVWRQSCGILIIWCANLLWDTRENFIWILLSRNMHIHTLKTNRC